MSRTGEFLASRGRRLNILRKIKKRRLKLHFKCSAKIFLACHLKRITQAVISDKKFKFRFGTNAFWGMSCMTSCQEPITRSVQLPYCAYATAFSQVGLFLDKSFPRTAFEKPITSKYFINNKLLIRNQDNSFTLKKKHGGRT